MPLPAVSDTVRGPCHANLSLAVRNLEVPIRTQAAVAARHVRNASSRRTLSVRRDVKWRWTLKVFWTAAEWIENAGLTPAI